MAAAYEARAHKQMYWVEVATDDTPSDSPSDDGAGALGR